MNGFAIEILASHDRSGFLCGVDELDRYFHSQVTQDVRRKAATCYVLVDTIQNRIAGFHTLAAASIPLVDIPESFKKRLPRYKDLPAVLIGRMAIAKDYQKKGLGSLLIYNAVEIAMDSPITGVALVVDAKDENAKKFYLHNGFIALESLPNRLILILGKK